MGVKIGEILDFLCKNNIAYEYNGDLNLSVDGYSALSQYESGTITWVKKIENWKNESGIALAVVPKGLELPIINKIICENSKEAFFAIIEEFWGNHIKGDYIGENSVIGSKVLIGKNVYIGNNCSITGNVKIGDDTFISDNVVITNRVKIGKSVYIQALSVIGEDGFGYYEDEMGNKTMIKHHGGVIIGDNVFIGSHVNIARGTLADTIIEDGVKIAPSTHIGHNNYIGRNSIVICSQLYGSVRVNDNAYIVGSIIRNQSSVGNNSMVGMGSVVTKNIEDNCVVYGSPAKVVRAGGKESV